MSGRQRDAKSAPQASFQLELRPGLLGDLPPDAWSDTLQRRLRPTLGRLMALLGIPGSAVIEVVTAEDRPDTGRMLELSVHGQRLRYPDDLLERVAAALDADTGDGAADVLARLAHSGASSPGELARLLQLACPEIVKHDPAALLGPAQAEAYATALAARRTGPAGLLAAWPLDPDWLRSVLRAVLAQRVSVANLDWIAEVLARLAGQPPEDAGEELLTALRPGAVELHLPWQYLRELTTSTDPAGLLLQLRELLFKDLGVTCPPPRLMPVDHLPPTMFAVKINHLVTPPMPGLPAGQAMVNATPEQLRRRGIEAEAMRDPLLGASWSIIATQAEETAAEIGLSALGPVEHLALSCQAVLRRHAACFVDRAAIESSLNQLRQAFPALVRAVDERLRAVRLAPVLRALVAEGISIRNLRAILERVLDYDDGPGSEAPGRAPTDAQVEFVRAGLRRQLDDTYRRDQDLMVYTLEPQLEARLTGPDPADARDQLLRALRARFAGRWPFPSPVLLTTAAARPALRAAVEVELPNVGVISDEEFLPGTRIIELATVGVG